MSNDLTTLVGSSVKALALNPDGSIKVRAEAPKLERLIEIIDSVIVPKEQMFLVTNKSKKEVAVGSFGETFNKYFYWREEGDDVSIEKIHGQAAEVLYKNSK